MEKRLIYVIGLILLLWGAEAYADFYQYKDAKGRLQLTNREENVPKKYRKKMKVIREIPPKPKEPLPEELVYTEIELPKKISEIVDNYPEERVAEKIGTLVEGKATLVKEKAAKEMSAIGKQEIVAEVEEKSGFMGEIVNKVGSKNLSLALYIVAIILTFLIIKKYLKRRRLNMAILLLLTGLLAVYLLKTYAETTHEKYTELKKKTDEIQQKMGERTKERIKIMEELNKSTEGNVN
ncbi:MAG: hypothetical protein IME96_03090 [Proteobacteria bacterium]|nr:hypothetical protein [Pseudomonadota bacterium]